MAPQRKKRTPAAKDTAKGHSLAPPLPADSRVSKPKSKRAPRRSELELLLEGSKKWGAESLTDDVPVADSVNVTWKTPATGKKKAAPKKPAKQKRKHKDEDEGNAQVEGGEREKGSEVDDDLEAPHPPPPKKPTQRKTPEKKQRTAKKKATKRDEEVASVDENYVEDKPIEEKLAEDSPDQRNHVAADENAATPASDPLKARKPAPKRTPAGKTQSAKRKRPVEGRGETDVDTGHAPASPIPVTEEGLNDLDDGELDDLISGKTPLSPVKPKAGNGRKRRAPQPVPVKRSGRIAARPAEKETGEIETEKEAETETVKLEPKPTPEPVEEKNGEAVKSEEQDGDGHPSAKDEPDDIQPHGHIAPGGDDITNDNHGQADKPYGLDDPDLTSRQLPPACPTFGPLSCSEMWRPGGSQYVDVAGPRLKARLEDWIKRYTMAMIQSSELAVKTKDANLKTAYRADQVLFSTLADAARAWANEVDAGQWVDDPHMGSDERDGLMFQVRSYQEKYKKTVGGLDGKVEAARRAWEAVKDGRGSMTTGSLGVGESISIVKKGWLSGGDELPINDPSD